MKIEDSNKNSHKLNKLLSNINKGKLKLPDGYTIPSTREHKKSFRTIRKSVYRGKKIHIETTYKITIDDEPLTIHTTVLDDGSVHCHAFPNYSFPSAVDMARKIVDSRVDFVEPVDELSREKATKHGGRK